MKLKTLSSLFLVFCLFLSCQSESKTENSTTTTTKTIETKTSSIISQKIGPEEFAAKLAANPKAQLVDVRTPQEFEQGHLDNAVNINYHGDFFIEELRKLDKDKTLFIYCQSGGRSGKACHKLKKMGFKEVYDLEGGYLSWTEKN